VHFDVILRHDGDCFFDKSIPATNSYAVSDSVLSAFDTDPMLARWGFKPVSIFNMIIAATALSLSVYTIVQNSAATHHKMLSGGWILGQTFEYLRLCEQHNPYAHCQQTVTNADFKRLDPILDALLEMPVDWPLETPATLANSATWHNPTASQLLVLEAINVHYNDKSVAFAFQVGTAVIDLLAMVDDPSIAKDTTKQKAYEELATNLNGILSGEFGGMCSVQLNPAKPSRTDLSNLFMCISHNW
jgi:hypothetical protein